MLIGICLLLRFLKDILLEKESTFNWIEACSYYILPIIFEVELIDKPIVNLFK